MYVAIPEAFTYLDAWDARGLGTANVHVSRVKLMIANYDVR